MTDVTVRIVPYGPDLTLQAGEVLMAGAERLGYRWPTVCGGMGDCLACKVRVVSGKDAVSPESKSETVALAGHRRLFQAERDVTRLACQMRVHGNIVVEKRGVRPQSGK